MPKFNLQQLEEKYVQQQKDNEKKFIPFEDTSNKVKVLSPEAEERKDGEYTFYDFPVEVDGKNKTWSLFLNQAVDLAKALKNHADGVVKVSRAKGSKKIIIS